MIDLHVHSNCSDGTYSPSELIDYAITKGLKAIALTDHDTIDGLDEIIEYADSLKSQGKENIPEVIPGIEFSTEYEGQDIHIVGLFINHKAPCFDSYLKEFINSRDSRNIKMCNKFMEDGIDISYEELKSRFGTATITRAHVAALLLEKGYVKSRQEAFDRYIGDHCPYFFPREKVSPELAINLILESDGLPILAHPPLYHMSDKRLDNLVSYLKSIGLAGIEAVYTTYALADERHMRSLANKYHLLLSGGSDFHGANKPKTDLAIGHGSLYVPDEFLDSLKLHRKNMLFTDMDGTLLNDDSLISDEMRNEILNITKNGHQFILTSGRPLPSIIEQIIKFKLDFNNMWIISNNGGIIYDYSHKSVIRDIRLSSNLIDKIVKVALRLNIHVHSYTDNEIVGLEEDDEIVFYRRRIHMPFIKVDNISSYLNGGAHKVQYIHLSDKAKLNEAKNILEDELGDEVDVFFSNDKYLEILPKGVNKGEAVLYLQNLLSYPHSHTYAAGDAENDIPMLKAACHGIAMSNAEEAVKKAADIITVNNNNNDGLLEIMRKYFNPLQ